MAIRYMTPNTLFQEAQVDVDEIGTSTAALMGYFNSALTEIYDVTDGFIDLPEIQDDLLETDYEALSAKGLRGLIKEYINYSIKLTEEDIDLARERQITFTKMLIKVRNNIMNSTFDANGLGIGENGFDKSSVTQESTYFNIHPDYINTSMVISTIATVDTSDMIYPNDILTSPSNGGGGVTVPLDTSNIFVDGLD